MTIVFKNSLLVSPNFIAFTDKIFSGPIQKIVALFTMAVFGCLALYGFISCRHQFMAKKNSSNSIPPKSSNKVSNLSAKKTVLNTPNKPNKPNTSKQVPPTDPLKTLNTSQKQKTSHKKLWMSAASFKGANKAFDTYQKSPDTCPEIKKNIIFQGIKSIEPVSSENSANFSAVELMLQVSGLKTVDLNHPQCARVVKDVFKYCNKEASEQLSLWLSKQDSFSYNLLKECLKVLIDKHEDQLPASLTAILQLMKIYQNNGWKDTVSQFDSPIISATKILIKNNPNDNHVVALGEWMMDQPEFNSTLFFEWAEIFYHKDQTMQAIHLYYPLLEKMIVKYKNEFDNWQAILILDKKNTKNLIDKVFVFLKNKESEMIPSQRNKFIN